MTIRGSNGYFGRAKFKTYLRSLPPNTIVGNRRRDSTCPIAAFVTHLINHPQACVSVSYMSLSYYTADDRKHNHDLPIWATRFISLIDGQTNAELEVTAAEALAALD